MNDKAETTEIKTWAIVEIMGHQQIAGFVQTVPFGGTIMLRVEAPDLPEQTEKLERTWNGETGQYVTADRVYPAEPGFTQFIGMGSIYRLTPCTQETALRAAERRRTAGFKLLNITPVNQKALPGDGFEGDGSDAGDELSPEDLP